MLMMVFSVLFLVVIILPVLVGVAFLTLLERKVLGLSQSRKGPNKVSLMGLLQPIADALKLFSNESLLPSSSNYFLFWVAPILSLSFSLMNWILLPLNELGLLYNFSVIIFLIILSVGLYPLLFSGWASNSKYALVGAVRGVAQTISYEISLALLILSIFLSIFSLQFYYWGHSQEKFSYIFYGFPIFVFWLVSCVAETNRTPFDFAEGESELVSGFNVEYGSGGFALIFMGEYSSILMLSMMTGFFWGVTSASSIMSVAWMVLFAFIWIWVRSTLPRYRYDKLMNLAWKSILPITLQLLMFYFSVAFFIL